MRSSAAVTCRAFVMLVCLVSIPLAAVFGASLPNIVVQWIDGRLPVPRQAAREMLTEAPLFFPPEEGASSESPAVSSRRDAGEHAGGSRKPHRSSISGPPQSGNSGPAPLVLGRLDQALAALAAGGPPAEQTADLVPVPPPTGPVPTAGRIPAEDQGGLTGPVEGSAPDLPPGLLDRVESRLRELGAVSYRLESWGPDAAFYHFCCRMAVGGSSTCTRHFEHISPRAVDAVTAVVRQVEAWRAGQGLSPSGRTP